jgi:hypothetical protein
MQPRAYRSPHALPEEWGVPAARVDFHGTDEDRDKHFEQQAQRRHDYIQKGPQVICQLCPSHHGFTVPAGKLFTGVDKDGRPQFRDLTVTKSRRKINNRKAK